MAKFTVTKALVVAALVCLAVDLAASASSGVQSTVGDAGPDHSIIVHDADADSTTAPPSTFKDKFKGFVSSVKEGASDAYESVSDSVSDAAHKADEKRKEVVASTKKLVNSAIDKIKNTFKQGEEEHEVPRLPENEEDQAQIVAKTAEDHAKFVVEQTKVAVEKAKNVERQM